MCDYTSLQALVTLSRQPSLSKTACLMNCPAAAICQRLTLLEQILGQQLIQQHQDQVQLTEAGHHYAAYSERVLRLAYGNDYCAQLSSTPTA